MGERWERGNRYRNGGREIVMGKEGWGRDGRGDREMGEGEVRKEWGREG